MITVFEVRRASDGVALKDSVLRGSVVRLLERWGGGV